MPGKSLKQDRVLERLENLILTGVFKPRERLVEADLARKLSVSRYWVRDALKILESKGLVQLIPYKGAVVSDFSEKEIEDIFVVRIALERLAIHLTLKNIEPSHIRGLKKLAGQFEVSHRKSNIREMIRINTAFHDYIFELSENPVLVQMIRDMRTRLHITRYASWSSPDTLLRIVEEHQQYITALEERDVKTLDDLAERHISYSKDHYLSQLRTVQEIAQRA